MKSHGINQITMTGPSPEKAGVGGSIPSLATIIFYNLANIPLPALGSNWSQFTTESSSINC